MSTRQKYAVVAGRTMTIQEVVQSSSYRTYLNARIKAVAELSGQKHATTYRRIYALLNGFFGVDVYAYRESPKDSLMRTCERYDLLDKVSLIVESELILLGL